MLNHAETRTEMLKWLSEKNRHIPLIELAFMLGIPFESVQQNEPFDEGEYDLRRRAIT